MLGFKRLVFMIEVSTKIDNLVYLLLQRFDLIVFHSVVYQRCVCRYYSSLPQVGQSAYFPDARSFYSLLLETPLMTISGAAPGPLHYEDLADLIDELGGLSSAAEIHGVACGGLAAGVNWDAAAWVSNSLSYMDASEKEPSSVARAELVAVKEQAHAALQDAELGFNMLLPAEETALPQRAEALGQWCMGFLSGFALAGKDVEDDVPGANEVAEIFRDFAAIANVALDEESIDMEASEHDFMQLIEYVRVAALTVFAQCSQALPAADQGPTLH